MNALKKNYIYVENLWKCHVCHVGQFEIVDNLYCPQLYKQLQSLSPCNLVIIHKWTQKKNEKNMSNFHLHFDLKLLQLYHATTYSTNSWLDPSFSCTCSGIYLQLHGHIGLRISQLHCSCKMMVEIDKISSSVQSLNSQTLHTSWFSKANFRQRVSKVLMF